MERVSNITDLGVRRRRSLGVAGLVLAVGGAVAMLALGAPRPWRLVLAVPFGMAALGLLQARERTCVVLTATGSRETDDGGVAPMSTAECAVAKRQSRSIVAKTVGFAVVATAAVWAL